MSDKYISRDNLELVVDGLKIGMTPNWNENDKSAVGYIENKPFYTEYGAIVDNYSGEIPRPKCIFDLGKKYDVIWNGISYNGLVCYAPDYNDGLRAIGGDGYPFYIETGGNSIYVEPESDYTVSVLGDIVHQLDEKYIPDSVARVEDVEEAFGEIYALKMDANNPVGTGSFSMNRKADSGIGKYSHAEGYNTTATGVWSHAESNTTTATGNGSHAEGGYTTASGVYSHVEGESTKASGEYSHAEGFYTTASGESQHVQGKYNIEDTSNKYAHIVGNGSRTVRSNAHTLDWDGNAWFQGDVYMGSTSGTNKDDGSKKLATEEYVDTLVGDTSVSEQISVVVAEKITAPVTAQVGQLLSVKAVDENGKPTEWEAVDFPSGGGTNWTVVEETVTIEGGESGKTGSFRLTPQTPKVSEFTEAYIWIKISGTVSRADRLNWNSKKTQFISNFSTDTTEKWFAINAVKIGDRIYARQIYDTSTQITINSYHDASGEETLYFALHWSTIAANEVITCVGGIMYR